MVKVTQLHVSHDLFVVALVAFLCRTVVRPQALFSLAWYVKIPAVTSFSVAWVCP